jgi:hypothetical protein
LCSTWRYTIFLPYRSFFLFYNNHTSLNQAENAVAFLHASNLPSEVQTFVHLMAAEKNASLKAAQNQHNHQLPFV